MNVADGHGRHGHGAESVEASGCGTVDSVETLWVLGDRCGCRGPATVAAIPLAGGGVGVKAVGDLGVVEAAGGRARGQRASQRPAKRPEALFLLK